MTGVKIKVVKLDTDRALKVAVRGISKVYRGRNNRRKPQPSHALDRSKIEK